MRLGGAREGSGRERVRALVCGVVLLVACGGTGLSEGEETRPDADLAALETLYARWSGTDEAREGTLRITLGFARGISQAIPSMRGRLVIEADGSLEAEVAGLDESAELWLVDNRPGADTSSFVDPGDRVRRIARIEPGEAGAPARLRGRLRACVSVGA